MDFHDLWEVISTTNSLNDYFLSELGTGRREHDITQHFLVI